MERPRLLIVDDTPDNILLLSETLKDTYQVQAATNGARALRIAQRLPAPDLILLDVMMPDLDGYQVCAALKAIPECAEIPIIFVTALGGAGDEEKGLAMGAVDYITKPFNPALVKARVQNHIELKRRRDDLEREVQQRTQELLKETLARQLLESDLNLALKLQLSMLPLSRQGSAGPGGFEVATTIRPARAIGGDLFDYLRLDGGRLLFAVGDVSDKGVAAALFMVRVLTMLHWLAPTVEDPAKLLQQLNEALCHDNEACMFVTLGLGIADLSSGEVTYAHGGHEAPIVITAGQPSQALELDGGPALGLFEAEFPVHRFTLGPDQALMLVSDGVGEANNPQEEEFGLQRLLASLGPELTSVSPDVVLAKTLAAVDEFTAGAEPFDDLTVLILRLRPSLWG
jgi:serine phosphatase RsbU (regulator of sigma subunit)